MSETGLSLLEERALASGEWQLVVDETTNSRVFYNTRTHRTTRDLRRELLAPADAKGTTVPQTLVALAHTVTPPPGAVAPPPASVEEQLAAAREQLRRSELELTHLRHCLFAGGSPVTPAAPQRAPITADALPEEIRVRDERIAALEELTVKLFNAASESRSARFICSVCRQVSAHDEAVLKATATAQRGAAKGSTYAAVPPLHTDVLDNAAVAAQRRASFLSAMERQHAMGCGAAVAAPHVPADELFARQRIERDVQGRLVPQYLPRSLVASTGVSSGPLTILRSQFPSPLKTSEFPARSLLPV